MRTIFSSLVAALTLQAAASAGTIVISPTSDFFTTSWAFGAPYVHDEGRDQLGISSINPFGMGASPTFAWEETTYLKFDISGLALTSPVISATLTFQTVARTGFPPDESGMVISAHYLLSDPNSIDPANAQSYVDFKNTQIANVIDSVNTTAFGIYTLDLTSLVNEWIENGDANFDYGTALTGRIGNEDSPDAWLAIVNSGYSGSPTLTIQTIPEASSFLLMSGGLIVLLGRYRRR